MRVEKKKAIESALPLKEMEEEDQGVEFNGMRELKYHCFV
jgi:hypothetical protein